MSLWLKSLAEITFADIDNFCQTMQPEGARLDYKGISFPKDLAKTIAAFANTMGGLILLGVDADKTLNKPVWPATTGMPTEPGLQERVYQIAQEAIYPPVRVGVSEPIENLDFPGHVLMVIRVNESREAPHAIDKNRRVYVYERTENKNEPYDLADMGRIEHLLRRRNQLVDSREAELQANLDRAARHMHRSECPIRWMSVAPIYRWRELHDPYACVHFHTLQSFPNRIWEGAHWSYQNCVGGSFGSGRVQRQNSSPVCVAVSSIASNGTFFGMGYAQEAIYDNNTLLTPGEDPAQGKMWMNHRNIREMAADLLKGCYDFYTQSKNPPGEVMFSIGIKNAFGLFMQDSLTGKKSNAPYIDPEFRIDQVLDSQNIFANRIEALTNMFDDIIFAFNAHAVVQ
jgi:hypothetical protein